MQSCIAAASSCPTFLLWNRGMCTENMDTRVFQKKLIYQRMNVIENVQFFVLRHVFTRAYWTYVFVFFTTCFPVLSKKVPQCFIIPTDSTFFHFNKTYQVAVIHLCDVTSPHGGDVCLWRNRRQYEAGAIGAHWHSDSDSSWPAAKHLHTVAVNYLLRQLYCKASTRRGLLQG